jgi:predicted metal-dependent HD superfamily phosphohydrolase
MLADNPALVELAIWYHDAIYHTARTRNEAQSAEWARRVVIEAGGTEEMAGRVGDLIMATDHLEPAVGADATLLCDIDLVILGASPERFDRYEQDIRAEYRWVPEAQYREGRRAILQQLLARARIYVTDAFFGRYEDQARSNLERSLERLAEGGAL